MLAQCLRPLLRMVYGQKSRNVSFMDIKSKKHLLLSSSFEHFVSLREDVSGKHRVGYAVPKKKLK